jgi:hypothetical protein
LGVSYHPCFVAKVSCLAERAIFNRFPSFFAPEFACGTGCFDGASNRAVMPFLAKIVFVVFCAFVGTKVASWTRLAGLKTRLEFFVVVGSDRAVRLTKSIATKVGL